MVRICIYFQVHQPFRLAKFSIFSSKDYFDVEKNFEHFKRAANKCYLPTNNLLLKMLDEYPDFKVSFSLTGTFIEQCLLFPEVLESFKELGKKKGVEFLAETYYHSLASLFSDKSEFVEQIKEHAKTVSRLFGLKPTVFRNTEALYNNEIALLVQKLGYKGIVTEGWDKILGWRSPNYIYKPPGGKIKILLRNYRLSDDVSYRFSARWWSEYPLTAEKYTQWLSRCEGLCVNLFMDYETFGEHQWAETGIFSFLEKLPKFILMKGNLEFAKPSELTRLKPVGVYDVPQILSWADQERDASAWLGNELQRTCFKELENLGEKIKLAGDEKLLKTWRLLTCSDNFYYMCTKSWADGDVHKYFSPYDSPYDAFIYFMNVIQDLKRRVGSK